MFDFLQLSLRGDMQILMQLYLDYNYQQYLDSATGPLFPNSQFN